MHRINKHRYYLFYVLINIDSLFSVSINDMKHVYVFYFITAAGSGCVDSVIGLGAVNGLLLVSLSISVIINIYCFIR